MNQLPASPAATLLSHTGFEYLGDDPSGDRKNGLYLRQNRLPHIQISVHPESGLEDIVDALYHAGAAAQCAYIGQRKMDYELSQRTVHLPPRNPPTKL